jgi:hypothetical protein
VESGNVKRGRSVAARWSVTLAALISGACSSSIQRAAKPSSATPTTTEPASTTIIAATSPGPAGATSIPDCPSSEPVRDLPVFAIAVSALGHVCWQVPLTEPEEDSHTFAAPLISGASAFFDADGTCSQLAWPTASCNGAGTRAAPRHSTAVLRAIEWLQSATE